MVIIREKQNASGAERLQEAFIVSTFSDSVVAALLSNYQQVRMEYYTKKCRSDKVYAARIINKTIKEPRLVFFVEGKGEFIDFTGGNVVIYRAGDKMAADKMQDCLKIISFSVDYALICFNLDNGQYLKIYTK